MGSLVSMVVAGHEPRGYTGSVCQAKRPNATIFLLFVGLWAGLFPHNLSFHNTTQYDTQYHHSLLLSACLATMVESFQGCSVSLTKPESLQSLRESGA